MANPSSAEHHPADAVDLRVAAAPETPPVSASVDAGSLVVRSGAAESRTTLPRSTSIVLVDLDGSGSRGILWVEADGEFRLFSIEADASLAPVRGDWEAGARVGHGWRLSLRDLDGDGIYDATTCEIIGQMRYRCAAYRRADDGAFVLDGSLPADPPSFPTVSGMWLPLEPSGADPMALTPLGAVRLTPVLEGEHGLLGLEVDVGRDMAVLANSGDPRRILLFVTRDTHELAPPIDQGLLRVQERRPCNFGHRLIRIADAPDGRRAIVVMRVFGDEYMARLHVWDGEQLRLIGDWVPVERCGGPPRDVRVMVDPSSGEVRLVPDALPEGTAGFF